MPFERGDLCATRFAASPVKRDEHMRAVGFAFRMPENTLVEIIKRDGVYYDCWLPVQQCYCLISERFLKLV